VARDADGGTLAGWLVLQSREHRLTPHWRTLARVQVHPSRQRQGVGGRLLRAAEAAARDLGLEALHLTVRGGTGAEAFYARHGYVVVGRIPRALRVAAGDDRDEVYMVRMLEEVGP
jgi:predicted N-acetyltransferase YhbS